MNTNSFNYMFTFVSIISSIIGITVPITALIAEMIKQKKSKNKTKSTIHCKAMTRHKYDKIYDFKLGAMGKHPIYKATINTSKPIVKRPSKLSENDSTANTQSKISETVRQLQKLDAIPKETIKGKVSHISIDKNVLTERDNKLIED